MTHATWLHNAPHKRGRNKLNTYPELSMTIMLPHLAMTVMLPHLAVMIHQLRGSHELSTGQRHLVSFLMSSLSVQFSGTKCRSSGDPGHSSPRRVRPTGPVSVRCRGRLRELVGDVSVLMGFVGNW